MDNNAYQPPHSQPIERDAPRKKKGGSFTLVKFLVVIIIIGILIGMLLPAVQSTRGPHPRTNCMNNMRQVMLAMINYESANGHFPPAYIADEDGKPMHSWRVLILPQLEQEDLYQRYSFDEPWDGPNNSKLHDEMVAAYRCPSSKALRESGINGTNYVVVTGARTAFPFEQSRTYAEILDGSSNTIGIVEIPDPDFHWMKPEDRTVPQILAQLNGGESSNGNHPGGFNVARLDGSTHFFVPKRPKGALRNFLNIDDGGTSDELE